MKAKAKNKKFDAVEMMRKIRDGLSEKYLKNPELEEEEWAVIRRKYGIVIKEKKLV